MNAKKYFLSLMLLLFFVGLSAQDQIIKLDGEIIQARIIEIGDEEVKYRLWIDDGIPYRMARKEIEEIILGRDLGHEVTRVNSNVPLILLSKEKPSYIFPNENKRISSFWDLEPYMLKVPDAIEHFYRSKSEKNKAVLLGTGSIFAMTYGFYKIDKHKDEYHDLWNAPLLFGQAFLYLVAPALGLTTMIYAIKTKQSKKKAMDAYGIKSIAEINLNRDLNLLECRLGATSNGVGLVLNF